MLDPIIVGSTLQCFREKKHLRSWSAGWLGSGVPILAPSSRASGSPTFFKIAYALSIRPSVIMQAIEEAHKSKT